LCALLVLISTKRERLSLDIDLARMIAQRYRLWRHCHSNTRWLGMDGPYSVRLWIRSHTAGTAFRASSFSRPSSTSCACWEWTTPRPRSWPAAFARPCHRRNLPSVPFARTRKSRNRRYRGGLRGLGAADPAPANPSPPRNGPRELPCAASWIGNRTRLTLSPTASIAVQLSPKAIVVSVTYSAEGGVDASPQILGSLIHVLACYS
jgi:hypothetical protein